MFNSFRLIKQSFINFKFEVVSHFYSYKNEAQLLFLAQVMSIIVSIIGQFYEHCCIA